MIPAGSIGSLSAYGEKRNEDGDVPPNGSLIKDPVSKPDGSDQTPKRHHCPPSSVLCHPILRKEVIQPQVPLRLPCYDFTPVADPTVVACLLAVGETPSGRTNSHGVTGGVYKARERIHRGVLIRDY